MDVNQNGRESEVPDKEVGLQSKDAFFWVLL